MQNTYQTISELLVTYFSKINNTDSIELVMQASIVLSGIIGQLLVIKKNIYGFWFWVFSNTLMVIASIFKEYYGMVVLYIFYIFMCFYGLKEWKKTSNTGTNSHNKEKIDPTLS